MNNPWFRVTITLDGTTLHFEHPTQPALRPGGWMEKVKKRNGDLSNGFWGTPLTTSTSALPPITESKPEIIMTKPSPQREISIQELRDHEDDASPWFVLKGEVYDGTPFLGAHPGGATSITSAAAQDITDEFGFGFCDGWEGGCGSGQGGAPESVG